MKRVSPPNLMTPTINSWIAARFLLLFSVSTTSCPNSACLAARNPQRTVIHLDPSDTTPPGDGTAVPGEAPALPPRRGLKSLKAIEQSRRRARHAHEDGVAVTKSRVAASPVIFDLDFSGGGTVVDPSAITVRDHDDRMHSIVETVAHRVMPAMHRLGWCPIPQHHMGGRRGPMGGIAYSEYKLNRPSFENTRSWAAQYPAANVAELLGRNNLNTFAIDVDIKNKWFAGEVLRIMIEHFGADFIRFGSKGFVMILRSHDDVEVRNRTLKFVPSPDDDGDTPMIEILGHGSLVTVYGHHHKTGDYFKWSGPRQPLMYGPEHVRLVTPAEIEAALADIAKIRPFAGSRKGGSRGCPVDPDAVLAYDGIPAVPGAFMPRIRLDDSRWVADGERIVDGRRRAMLTHSLALVAGNGFLILGDPDDRVWPGIVAPAVKRVLGTMMPGSGRDEAQIKTQYLKLIDSAPSRSSGPATISPWRLSQAPDGTTVKAGRINAVAPTVLRSAALAWLGAPDHTAGIAVKRVLKARDGAPNHRGHGLHPRDARKIRSSPPRRRSRLREGPRGGRDRRCRRCVSRRRVAGRGHRPSARRAHGIRENGPHDRQDAAGAGRRRERHTTRPGRHADDRQPP